MSAAVQLHPHKAGDLWPGLSSVTIKVDGAPLDLTGAVVKMHLKRYVRDVLPAFALSSAGAQPGIVLGDDAALGAFHVPPVVVDVPAGKYFWDLQVTQGGQPVTYASGSWQILPDVVTN